MIVVFEIDEGTITPNQAVMLAEASPLWVFSTRWRVVEAAGLPEEWVGEPPTEGEIHAGTDG